MKFFVVVICIFLSAPLTAQKLSKRMDKGIRFFFEEKYQEALTVFEKESHKVSTCETKFWIASCYFKMEDFSKAKDSFLAMFNNTCSGIDMGYAVINLGSCYFKLKETNEAFFYYDLAVDQFPELASNAYFNKGQALYSLSRFEAAKVCYDRSIAADSTDYFVFMKRQEISFILHDYDAALKDMLKAKTLKADLDIETNMAFCYSMLNKYKEADSIYQLIYDEKDYLFLNNYGFNKHKLGQSEEGIRLIKKSLELNPDNSYAYRNLAIISIDNKNLADACIYLKKAKDLNFSKYYGSEVDDLLLENCK